MQPYQLDSTDWIKQELAGLLGEQVTRDIDEIIRLYSLYDGDGQRWQVEYQWAGLHADRQSDEHHRGADRQGSTLYDGRGA